jgi:hypothetical protein
MSSMARSTWRPWGWRLSIIVNSSPLRRADPSPRDNVSVVEDAIDPKAVSSEATMMAPDRPAEADPLHQCRVAAETSARSLSTSETVASDTPTAVATVSRVGRRSFGHCSAGRIPASVATWVTSGRQTSGRVGSAGDGHCSGAAVVPR